MERAIDVRTIATAGYPAARQELKEVRCTCNKLLGRLNGKYELKCPRCHKIVSGDCQ